MTKAVVDRILASTEQSKIVVICAARALELLEGGDSIAARNLLQDCLMDFSALQEANLVKASDLQMLSALAAHGAQPVGEQANRLINAGLVHTASRATGALEVTAKGYAYLNDLNID